MIAILKLGTIKISKGKAFNKLTFPLPDYLKPSPLLFYSVLCQTILLVNGEPLGGKGLRKYGKHK